MGDSKYGPHIMLRLDGRQEQLIFLDATQPNFGGQRWWFICLSGKRCLKLYLPHGAAEFLCREELNLSYESQHVEKVWRLQNRVRQLRAKLDVENRSPALPGKPKGMWNRTYNRLVNRIADAQSDAIQAMLHWTRRCNGAKPFAGALD